MFYGDEAGMQGLGNLTNRKTVPWGQKDPELIEFFQEGGAIRRKEKFMETADLKLREITGEHIMFERITDKEKMLIVISRTGEINTFNLPREYENIGITYSYKNSNQKTLSPYGAVTCSLIFKS